MAGKSSAHVVRRLLSRVAPNIKPYSEVPGPKPLPLLGNTWRFVPYIGNYRIEEVDQVSTRLCAEFGRIVKVAGLLNRPDMLFVFDADLIEQIFRSEDALPHRPSMPSLDAWKHGIKKHFFGELPGVIAVHGEKWLQFRTRVQQIMLQPRTARLYVGQIQDTAQEFVERDLFKNTKSQGGGEPPSWTYWWNDQHVPRIRSIRDEHMEVPGDFLNEINKWSLESIARVALDVRLGCLQEVPAEPDTQDLIDAVNTFFTNVGILELKPPVWKIISTPRWRAYIKALDQITSITSRHIQGALHRLRECPVVEEGKDASLLQRLLALDRDAHIAHVLAIDLFLVGIDTTSSAVSSILYQLARHPEIQETLYAELKENVGDQPLNSQNLDKLQYLRAVIKETLRMYPVVIGNGRLLTKDTVIGDYLIPKGTQVIFQHYVISNKDEYFPMAKQFVPERWLKANAATSVGCPEAIRHSLIAKPTHAFASLPFGYGKRMCLGRRFADLELQAVIAKIILTYRVEYHHKELPYRVHPMYVPDGPLRFKMTDRKDIPATKLSS